MQVLITGGAGFIGSHLAEIFLNQGHHVVALDNYSTGRQSNVEHLMSNPRFCPVNGSVLDEEILQPLVANADLIYHLAAAVGVKYVLQNLVETLQTNARGTENVIRLAHDCGGKKVILASTSEVYGKSLNLPYKEDHDLSVGPTAVGRWGYACSKMLDEFLALAYHKEKGLPVVVLRLFNTVGPRQTGRYGMVIPTFVGQAVAGEPITVHGDGTQTRCFAYVGDVAGAMANIAQVPRAEGQVFNLGNNRPVTVGELAVLVKRTLDSPSPIVNVPYENVYGPDFEDIPRRIPDISKIQGYIEYHPDPDLRRVIQEVAGHLEGARADGGMKYP